MSPLADYGLGFFQAVEDFAIEQLVTLTDNERHLRRRDVVARRKIRPHHVLIGQAVEIVELPPCVLICVAPAHLFIKLFPTSSHLLKECRTDLSVDVALSCSGDDASDLCLLPLLLLLPLPPIGSMNATIPRLPVQWQTLWRTRRQG